MSSAIRRILQLEQRLGRLAPASSSEPYVLPGLQVGNFEWGAGWEDYDTAGTYGRVRVVRDALGWCGLEGLARRTSGVGTTILIVPPGFRPAYRRMYGVNADPNIHGRVDVHADGTVSLEVGGAGAVGLDGLVWLAA